MGMNLKNFDLNLLRVFDAIAQERSTVKAAVKLNMSQPAVSAALGRLREAMKDPLFERSGGQMRPTAYAHSLETPVQELLEQIERTLTPETEFNPLHTHRTFRFAASDYFADHIMPRLASRFEREAPNARLQMTPLAVDDHLDSLERFQTDAILFLSMPVPGWMRSCEVMVSHFRVIASRDHSDLAQAGIRPGQRIPMDFYCGSQHGLYSPSGETKTWVDEALKAQGRVRHVAVSTSTFQSLGRVIAKTQYLATTPAATAFQLAQTFPLEVYQHPLEETGVKLMMAWHYRNDAKPEQVWFRDQIKNAIDALPST